MNSGYTILRKQNEDESITLLAAQRAMYTEAKREGVVSMAMCLGVPLLFTILQIFVSVPYQVLAALSFTIFIADLILAQKRSELLEEAASVQQAFDARVYGIPFENVSFNRRQMLLCAKKLMRSKEEKERLKDWYLPSIAGKDPAAAILECQHENAWWSERLLHRYLVASIAVSAATVAIVAVIAWCRHAACENLFFLIPILEWMVRQIWAISRAKRSERELREALETFSLGDLGNIKRVQGKLYKARMSAVLVPDKIYRVFRAKDEREIAS